MLTMEAIGVITHALGRAPSQSLSPLSIINDAGAAMCNMHPWGWLIRYTSSLGFVAGQTYVTLPGDFESFIAPPATTDGTGFEFTDLDEILKAREATASGRPFLGALGNPSFTGAAAPGQRQLEIYPTPSLTEANVLAAYYRAGWLVADGDTQYLDVRPFMRPLFVEILTAVALGREERDTAGVDARMTALRGSSIFLDACNADGRAQPGFGPIRGGAMQVARGRGPFTGVFPRARTIS